MASYSMNKLSIVVEVMHDAEHPAEGNFRAPEDRWILLAITIIDIITEREIVLMYLRRNLFLSP